jgi:hypothetical protein
MNEDMKPFHYEISIRSVDLHKRYVGHGPAEDETYPEFLEKLKSLEGKLCFRARVTDYENSRYPEQKGCESLWFDSTDTQMEAVALDACLDQAQQIILRREQKKLEAPVAP